MRDAKNRGADLVITPVAKEGFVFILHKDNPIDRLTQPIGKEKAITVLRLAHFNDYETGNEYTRFIVLTREKGGEFEVINEGAVLSYENGILTPDNIGF